MLFHRIPTLHLKIYENTQIFLTSSNKPQWIRYTTLSKKYRDWIFCRNTNQGRRAGFSYTYAEIPSVHSCKFSSMQTQPFVWRPPMSEHGRVLHGEIEKVSGINFLYKYKVQTHLERRDFFARIQEFLVHIFVNFYRRRPSRSSADRRWVNIGNALRRNLFKKDCYPSYSISTWSTDPCSLIGGLQTNEWVCIQEILRECASGLPA